MKKALEPYIKLAPYIGIGLVVVAIVVAGILYIQRGAHVVLRGSVQKVRTLALDENSSAAILDFRVRNPSDYPFVVREVSATMTEPGGNVIEGFVIADVDAQRLFEYYPSLGQKYNDSLMIRTRIEPKQTVDLMLAVRFDVPEARLQARENIQILVDELDGPVSEINENQR